MSNQTFEAPSDWVVRFMPLVASGASVLDVACGAGRHTALFASAGFRVTAIDRDVARLGALANLREVEALRIDLEDGSDWPFPDREFGAIVVTNYLHRPLLPLLVNGLEPQGVLIYETFAAGNERFGKPSRPEFLLEPGELLKLASGGLTVAAYEHGVTEEPRPAVVQRICAIRGDRPVRLEKNRDRPADDR